MDGRCRHHHGTTHTLDELYCDVWHQIRVSAYGNGTTYAAAWGEQSWFLEVITDTCVLPEFGASSYTFSVADDAEVGASVGTVSATIAGGDAVSYSIYLKIDERKVCRRRKVRHRQRHGRDHAGGGAGLCDHLVLHPARGGERGEEGHWVCGS